MSLHPEEIARQLTLIEFDLFKSIRPSEFIKCNWMSKDKEKKSTTILQLIQRFNKGTTYTLPLSHL